MKRASSSSSSIQTVAGRPRRRKAFGIVAGVSVAALTLGACGGGDDESDDTTPETTLAAATTTTQAAVTTTTTATETTPAVPDEPDYVTEGAIVIVANSSNVDGGAGRMSDRLAAVGFEMGTATNGTEGQLEVTKIYYDPANENALPVAESLREALGGGDIQVVEVGVPAPVDSGDPGDATVIVSMGNDTADKTLEELQGRAPAESDDTGDDSDGGSDTTEASTDTTEASTDTTEADG
ncbi:LytR C-terminal domain-containing protein [Ilumatobacter fluminis]|uniref:LytR C-terminal domain-containing protein n=1 Tax=Ilumatobacter fluminis TaxID=467091 RepID=UPI00105E0F78|nr:LytR C-terminal domain-containing protein [Ilumatobacter fluminis]